MTGGFVIGDPTAVVFCCESCNLSVCLVGGCTGIALIGGMCVISDLKSSGADTSAILSAKMLPK